MGRILRSCIQSLLKLVNSIIGMVGVGMALYSLWMIRVWYKNLDGDFDSQIPWFIYTFLGLGVSICVIACSGHIAAETANGHCLCCYTVFIFVLVLLEAAVIADVFLNSHWEEDFPEDATGRLYELKKFVKSNFDLCKWIGSLVVAAQGISIILAMILKALGPYQRIYYDSDDEYAHATVPLLKDRVHSSPYGLNPSYPTNNEPWNARVYEKVNR
ncbi:tetraspanin-19-like [Aristolochia californica]|uniref:tetraspanin-19-like n=1 Tax=Aristolochia californica TaxID=171875 RepID=UPI0035D85E0E